MNIRDHIRVPVGRRKFAGSGPGMGFEVGPTGRQSVRRASLRVVVRSCVIFGLTLGAEAAAAAPAPVPCSAIGGGKYECDWWRPGDGRSGGAIVVRDGKVVGYLHQGRNWITCQQAGAAVHNEDGDHNRWYGWTQSDYGDWGWASALDARGGDDYGKFSGAPSCENAHGSAPGVGGLWGANPPGGDQPETPPPGDAPSAPPADDTSCSQLTTKPLRSAVARLEGLVEVNLVTRKGKHIRYIESERHDIGTVTVRTAGCKRKGRWVPAGEPIIKVHSNGLDKDARPKRGGPEGWGLTTFGYGQRSGDLTVNVVRCYPDGFASFHQLRNVFGFLAAVTRMPHPVSAAIGVGDYLAETFVPPGKGVCGVANRQVFRLHVAGGKRMRLSFLRTVGRTEVIDRFSSVGDGTGRRLKITMTVRPTPGPHDDSGRRPGVQP
jgi:hypothetical protein